jgi:two-component system, sensor histidine kinase and response regulator
MNSPGSVANVPVRVAVWVRSAWGTALARACASLPQSDREITRARAALCLVVSVAGSLVGPSFAFSRLGAGDIGFAVACGLLAVACASGIVIIAVWGKVRLCTMLLCTSVGAFFLFMLATGRGYESGIVWILTFPTGAFFLLGLRAGATASVGYLALCAAAFAISRANAGPVQYTTEALGRLGVAYLLVCAAAFLWERARTRSEARALTEDLQREVATKELEKARDAAEAATAAKSMFLAHMSHEIRTPINGIMGMNSLLLETPLTEEQRDYVETQQAAAEALLRIVDDVLDFSKIEAGKMEIDHIVFDLRTTIEGAMELVSYKAVDKELEIVTLIHSSVPLRVQGDPGRLRQIIINLAGNAVKFTHDGEVVLSVTKESESDSMVKLRFEVKDTGIGISTEDRKKLFHPFSQVDASVNRQHGGTGLGLAISQRLVELMKGQIGVESDVGKGSTFWFSLPLEKCLSTAAEAHVQPADIAGLKVMVVDLNPTVRNALSHYLASWGCAVTEAHGAHDALAALRTGAGAHAPIDVAIVSSQLEEFSGLQLARIIKSDASIRDTRLVLVTATATRGDATVMIGAGIDGYLIKPVKYAQLLECLRLVAAKGNAAAAGRDAGPILVTRHTVAEAMHRRRMHILLAEDNEVNQKVATRILEKAGYSCDVAANGVEVLDAYQRHRYDLILMDCQMPVLSGYDATRAIRDEESRSGRSRIPILALTAHGMSEDRQKCLEAGMDDYIAKPVNRTEMEATIRKWEERITGEGRKEEPAAA